MSNNSIIEIENIEKLIKLEKLQLSHNYIKKIKGIFNLNKLKELKLNDNSISVIPEQINMITYLFSFDIGKNKIKNLE